MLQAIDEQPAASYDASEALEGLSILDDSFLEKFVAFTNDAGGLSNSHGAAPLQAQPVSLRMARDVRLDGEQKPIGGAIGSLPAAAHPGVPADDGELWQSLLLEQKIRYEGQIQKLTKELMQVKRLVRGDPALSGASRGGSGERDKWVRINTVLDTYFAEYNVQF